MATIIKHDDPSLWDKLPPLEGAVFVTPTDTVYGFSCAYSNKVGVARIRRIKGDCDQPYIVLVPDIDTVEELAKVSSKQRAILEQYWPGPITFILFRKNISKTIAVRMPTHALVQDLMLLAGPIVSTSCNRHGEPPVINIDRALKHFGNFVDFFIDGGPCRPVKPSTLVDLTTAAPKVLRQGSVSFTH